MKKIILFLLLLTSFLYSDAKIYMGVGGGVYSETLDDIDKTNITANMARIKVGYGIREAYSIEFSVDYVAKSNDTLFLNDGARYGLNVELIKAFDWGIYVNPFVKAGFGMGYMETEASEKDDSLSFGTYNLGLGMYIPMGENLDIELGYDYKYTSYQKVKTYNPIEDKMETADDIQKSMSHTAYIGVNVRF